MKRIITRFRNKEDLDVILHKLGIENNGRKIKEIHYPSMNVKFYKESVVARERQEYWKEEWFNMPEYISNKQEAYSTVDFFFDNISKKFIEELFEQNISDKTKSIWYPKIIMGQHSHYRVVGGSSDVKYPIYVVSKGRHDRCYTSRFLSQMEVNHFVVVEPQEFLLYENNIKNQYATIIPLDMTYKEKYDTFDELGDAKSKGPGGARNFCWDHSIKNGHKMHWVMDDNTTEGFHYMNHNRKQKCRTGAIFKACEDFVDRYENIAIAGLNYKMFCKECDKTPAFVMNTRIYSYLLIRNDIPYRWRGRYNEDTDLSLRVLKDGWCTVQFNAFLAGKSTTQKVKGGNTADFYSKEGTLPKSKMLEDMHPDVAKVVWKFNRWHHQVDYSKFTQKLKLRDGIERKYVTNNYGMLVIETEETETTDSKSYLEEKYKTLIEIYREIME